MEMNYGNNFQFSYNLCTRAHLEKFLRLQMNSRFYSIEEDAAAVMRTFV